MKYQLKKTGMKFLREERWIEQQNAKPDLQSAVGQSCGAQDYDKIDLTVLETGKKKKKKRRLSSS